MPSKILAFGISLVLLVCLFVFMVEIFFPISMKIDFNTICRETLLKMEMEGGLSGPSKDELETRLYNRGFESVIVEANEKVKFGQELVLSVEADYTYSKLQSIFIRETITKKISYNKRAIVRKIVN